MFKAIIIGAGPAGAVAAREIAEKRNEKVLVIDSRSGVGGNCYDESDDYGITIHKYGPHIFHTNIKRVYDYLSRFTDWYDYQHEVVGAVDGMEIPIPFNLNTLDMVFGDEAPELTALLIEKYGEGARVPILKLREDDDPRLKKIADYVYEKIFLKYTMKQWGKKPEEIDPAVSGRVPVVISRDNRYFQDEWQGMPKDGYTKLFEKMLDHPNISLALNTEATQILDINPDRSDPVMFTRGAAWVLKEVGVDTKVDGDELVPDRPFTGRVIYTGAIDELFGCRYGRLPYRSLDFRFEHYGQDRYQSAGVVNYTVSEEFTRITEFKTLTGELKKSGTTIVKEYPYSYSGAPTEIPYYAINNKENDARYQKYRALADSIPGLTLLGRLAEYKYYNIDAIVDRALEMDFEV